MRTLILALTSILLASCGQATPPSETGEPEASRMSHDFDDPEVTRIHEKMMSVIDPDGGWEAARYLEFDWAIQRLPGDPIIIRSHRWDRYEGNTRIEYTHAEGELVAVFNTNNPEAGQVWLDGVLVEGERARDLLRAAHRVHINDSYWIIMPYKWTDPGVHLRFLGEQSDENDREWEVVELSFEADAGLTPQNVYHAFMNPETGRMERWKHFSNAEADPTPHDWVDWEQVGPIQLAENRLFEGRRRIWFPHLRVETEVPGNAFAGP